MRVFNGIKHGEKCICNNCSSVSDTPEFKYGTKYTVRYASFHSRETAVEVEYVVKDNDGWMVYCSVEGRQGKFLAMSIYEFNLYAKRWNHFEV